MKTPLIATLVLAAATALFCSCSKKTERRSAPAKTTATQCEKPGLHTVSREAKNTITTEIHCNGTCNNQKCALEGIATGKDAYIQCKCTACAMEVKVTTSKTGTDPVTETNVLPDGQVPVYFLSSFEAHMQQAFPGLAHDLVQVTIIDDQQNDLDNYVITYAYELAGGATGTVTFTWDRKSGETQKVDCTGTCDCRERYYPATGAIECTCKDCSMTITKMALVPIGGVPTM